MKAVLISIKPKWCELIASGKKTVEVRKTLPKLEMPFKCYIYQTQGGGVIGEFTCYAVSCFLLYEKSGDIRGNILSNISKVSVKELWKYAGKSGKLFGWGISNLVIYDKPKELSEFRKPCVNDLFCESCALYSNPLERCGNVGLIITRPPQSWCYVEELKGENYV